MAGIIKAIYSNKNSPPTDPEVDFTGKTIIVTGASSGLGLEAAAKFAKANCARLILAVRSPQKGASAQRIVQHLASDPKCRVEVWELEMGDYASIQAFAKRVTDELPRVDIALMNAGVYQANFTKSKYGWEQTLQVNVISTTYLALLLLPKLNASSTDSWTPVLQFTSSGLHYAVKLTDDEKAADTNTLEMFNGPGSFVAGKLYRTSKLFIQYAAREIAALARPDETQDPSVLIMTVCPGACQSDLSRDVTGMMMSIMRYYANMLFLRTPEEGSRTLVSGTQNGIKGHGQFWQHDIIKEPAEQLRGEEGKRVQEKVFKEILEALRKDIPDVMDLVKPL